MIIPFGSILSWSVPPKLNGWFTMILGYAQNFFTKMKETHASIVLDNSELLWAHYEFEATTSTRVSLFRGNKYAIGFTVEAPDKLKVQAIRELEPFLGRIYGIVQNLWFIGRWFFELFGLDVRRWWNPLGFFWLICSELVFRYLHRVAELAEWGDLILYLDQWKPNNVHAGDIRIILDFMVEHKYSIKLETI